MLKYNQEVYVARLINVVVSFVYYVSVLTGMWCLRNAISNRDGHLSKIYWSQARKWFLLEQDLFFGQITFGMIFLLVAYT